MAAPKNKELEMRPKVEAKAGCSNHTELQLRPLQQDRLVPAQEQGTLVGNGDSVGPWFICSNSDNMKVAGSAPCDLVLVVPQAGSPRGRRVCPWSMGFHMVIHMATHSTRRGERACSPDYVVRICG